MAAHPPPTAAQPYTSVSKSDGEASEADLLVTKTTPDHLRKSKWYHSSFILMAEIMGAGLLGLPYAMSRLGWVVGLSVSVCGAFFCTYSGILLWRVRHELGYGEAESYYDVALGTGGPLFGSFVRAIVYVSWAAVLPYFLLACADSLQGLVPGFVMATWQWALVVCGLLLPALQLRTFHQLSYLALPSTVAVVLAVAVVLGSLAVNPNVERAPTQVWVPETTPALQIVSHISSFLFAYMGHSMYFEVMREMTNSGEFGKALVVSNCIMGTCYTATAAIAYAASGDAVKGFLPESMPSGPAKSVVSLLLAFHTAVSYLVAGQPLHRALHARLFPRSVDNQTRRAALDWLLCSAATLVLSLAIALAVPVFSDLQDLLGAVLGAPLVFGLPAFFFLRASRASGTPLRPLDLGLCVLFLGFFTPLFAIVGTGTTLVQIRDSWISGEDGG